MRACTALPPRLSRTLSPSLCVRGPSVLEVCAHRVGNKAAIKHM